MDNEEIISELINFFSVAIIFLIGIAIVFRIFCKHFRFNNKNIEMYGLLLNLNATSLLSIATTTINYLFLVWCTISFEGINIIYVAVIFILVIFSEAIIDNFKGLPISLLLAAVNCAAIQITHLIYKYLTEEAFSYILMIVLGLVVLFVFLYYTYNLFRNINNIVIKNKYLKSKNYKV